MYCTKCGNEISGESRFCPQCGNPMGAGVTAPEYSRLMLDKRRKKIAGVCAGFARYFGMDLTLMRVIWLATAICTGVGFLVYLAAWIVLPSDADIVPVQPFPQQN